MRSIEHDIQCNCIRWFRLAYPDHLMVAIPNGGARNAVTGKRLKEEGVTAGAPDLFLFHSNDQHNGLAIEMKTRTGKQSPSQKNFQKQLEGNGYQYSVCRSLAEFMEIVTDYLRN